MPAEEWVVLSFLRTLLEGTDLNEQQRAVLLNPDRALSAWRKCAGWTGTRERGISVEVSGEQKTVLHGKDADGNIVPYATTADKKLVVETR